MVNRFEAADGMTVKRSVSLRAHTNGPANNVKAPEAIERILKLIADITSIK
jgi:hypothetical protein